VLDDDGICSGDGNEASGTYSTVSREEDNKARGSFSLVSGGFTVYSIGENDWISGG